MNIAAIKTCTCTQQLHNHIVLYRSHVYDAVEMHSQKVKTSSTTDYEYALMSSSSKMPSTAKSNWDIKADAVKLQENLSCAATNEFSWHAPLSI